MLSTTNTPTPIATKPPAGRRGAARFAAARFAAAAVSTAAVLAALLIGGSSPASAAGAQFVPEDTDASWNGAVATVTFREVGPPADGGVTTISVKVTADVDVVCRRGESTLHIHRSASAIDVQDYPIDDEGVVAGTARVPLVVSGIKVTGWTCVNQRVALTAALEDFWTGATLVHKS